MSKPKTALDLLRTWSAMDCTTGMEARKRVKEITLILAAIPANAPEQIAALKAEVVKVEDERDEDTETMFKVLARAGQAEADLARVTEERASEERDVIYALKRNVALVSERDAARADAEKLAGALDKIAHPGEVYGEGDYYAGVQAGQESAAEDAQEAIDAYRKASK